MISFPNAKINIGLRIVGRRSDGFHAIETAMYPVPWYDVLEIHPTKKFSFHTEGIPMHLPTASNLCVRAFQLLQKQYGIPPVKIFLLKNIPPGSGLGGGSADAAFTLRMLNDLFKLKLSTGKLKKLASRLGSDCSFFIQNKPALATGRGERLKKLRLDLSSYYLAIVKPAIHVDTALAYEEWDKIFKKEKSFLLKKKKPLPLSDAPGKWNHFVENDFEELVSRKHPQLCHIKDKLKAAGAVYTSMSGSGSAIYGIFRDKPRLDFPGMTCRVMRSL